MMRRHAELLSEHMGEERGCKEFRKHVTWYLKGFAAGGPTAPLARAGRHLAALDALLADLDPDEPFPVARARSPRGRQGRRVDGWCFPRAGSTTPTAPAACSVRMRGETTGG